MDIISFPNNDFKFEQLTLGVPSGLQGGSYFTKIYNNDGKVYLQSPSCLTKQGVIKTGKKMYVDLMFTPDNQNILSWFETLVERVQSLIYEKRNLWFHNEMDLEDIEGAFTTPVRTYKSGKFYLIRANINANNFHVYDEDENPVNIESLNDSNNKIIPLIEILGVKFTSRSFQLEISLKQIMVIQEKNILNNCLIKRNNLNQDNKIKTNNNSILVDNEKINDEQNVDEQNVDEQNVDEQNVDEQNVDEQNENDLELNEKIKDEENLENLENFDNNNNNNNNNNEIDNDDNIDNDENDKIDEIDDNVEILDNTYNLEEVDINCNDEDQLINLKKPNEVYHEIWKEARKKAKMARKAAINAYLDAKNIKATYMLNEINNDSDDEFDEIIENININNENQINLA